MKIRTITCHDVYNYGASLQAFALQSFLETCGHDVEIINYKPAYLNIHYRISLFIHPDSPIYKYTQQSLLLRLLYGIKRFIWYLPSWKRKVAFDRFTAKYLKLTRPYRSHEELVKNPPIADVYIAGSDQIWNSTTMLNGKDPAFYLQFAPKINNKISYAASFGATTISEQCKITIKKWLSNLDKISVRETSGVNILHDLGLSGTHVCDPVFLLTADEWRNYLSIKKGDERYVLIYNLTSINNNLLNDAINTAKQLNAKLYSVSPFKIKGVDKNYVNVSPKDFVSLISNASFVFTNSFHATAFSIIFHRQFCTYNYHSNSNSSRMYSILAEMELLDRLNPQDVRNNLNRPIDYKTKIDFIETSMNKGKTWLLNNL